MPAFDMEWILGRLALLPPLLLSLVVHECAHARTALAFGDPTAKQLGRITLNPLAHLDPIGTLCIIFTGFGWAKPVPVNPANLSPPRLGDIAVSAAGPLSNLMLAVVVALLLRVWQGLAAGLDPSTFALVRWYLLYVATVNICLFAFNLIPLFPLDGHHIVREMLPYDSQRSFMDFQRRYGAILLMALLFGPRLASRIVPALALFDPLGWFFLFANSIMRGALGI